jgi:hypothetical protein
MSEQFGDGPVGPFGKGGCEYADPSGWSDSSMPCAWVPGLHFDQWCAWCQKREIEKPEAERVREALADGAGEQKLGVER